MDENGAIYGTTVHGGHGYGVVFQLTPKGAKYHETILWNFGNGRRDGQYPTGPVMIDASGALYGTTSGGGTTGSGTVFELSP